MAKENFIRGDVEHCRMEGENENEACSQRVVSAVLTTVQRAKYSPKGCLKEKHWSTLLQKDYMEKMKGKKDMMQKSLIFNNGPIN